MREPVVIKEPAVIREPVRETRETVVVKEPTVVKETVREQTIVQQPTVVREETVVNKPIRQTVVIQSNPDIKMSESEAITYELVKFSQEEIENIYITLQKEFKDFNFKNSKVTRAQKISYGFRLIIIIDEILYESILRFNSATGVYKLLRWRKVTQKEA